jgi:hypothetical protein
MPWKPSDATKHTSKASTAKLRRLWAHVANSVLSKSGDEASAVKQANAAVARNRSDQVKTAVKIIGKKKKRK